MGRELTELANRDMSKNLVPDEGGSGRTVDYTETVWRLRVVFSPRLRA